MIFSCHGNTRLLSGATLEQASCRLEDSAVGGSEPLEMELGGHVLVPTPLGTSPSGLPKQECCIIALKSLFQQEHCMVTIYPFISIYVYIYCPISGILVPPTRD